MCDEIIVVEVEQNTTIVDIAVATQATVVDCSITAVGTRGAGIPDGGTTGQKLIKKSDASYDYEWITDVYYGTSETPPEGVPDGSIYYQYI